MACATCGRPVPLDSFLIGVCTMECVDAFMDRLAPGRGAAPSPPPPAAVAGRAFG